MENTSMSARQIRDLTSSIWRHVQEQAGDPLARASEIRQVIAQCADAGRDRELQALVEGLDALTPGQQRLFASAVDDIQVRSKLWLIDELASRRDLAGATLFVLGAWYGVLPLLFTWRLRQPPARMVCVDISADACTLGRQVIGSRYPRIEYQVGDAMDLDYQDLSSDPSSVLVNTICEHLPDAAGWWARIPPGQLSVLQSNNYDLCPDHVNSVRGLEEMKVQTPLSRLLYEGVLQLPIFDRFMLIGYR